MTLWSVRSKYSPNCRPTVWAHLPLAAQKRSALLPHFWEQPVEENGHFPIIWTKGGWTGFVSVRCALMCSLSCVPTPVWSLWPCGEEWSYWAAFSVSPTLVTPAKRRPSDWWRQEDSLQWLSVKATLSITNSNNTFTISFWRHHNSVLILRLKGNHFEQLSPPSPTFLLYHPKPEDSIHTWS